MVRRLELMKWLNTCPDRNWDIVHEDEGHMRVLFIFDDEDDEDKELVLSPAEKERLIHYFWTEAHPDWIENWLPKDVDPTTGRYTDDCVYHEAGEEYEEMHWDGVQLEEGGRMFDLCMHFVDGKQWVEVYECDWMTDNWTTNTQKVWLMHEEMK